MTFKDDILETVSVVSLAPLPVLLHNYAHSGIICTFLEIIVYFFSYVIVITYPYDTILR